MSNSTQSSVSEGFTDNPYINGVLWSGERLPRNTITYSFVNSDSYHWTSNSVEAVEQALNEWESVANIEFVPVSDNNLDADFRLSSQGNAYFDIGIGIPGSVNLAQFGAPGVPNQGEGIFNVEELNNDNFGLEPGQVGYKALIHEIGHGLGLGHPHDDSHNSSFAFPGIPDGEAHNAGPNGLNQGVWTIMSYNNGYNDRGFESTPMAFDISAIQHLYGANSDYASGNNIYMLSDLNSYSAIWDTGGNDTISAIKLSSEVNVQIDLREAPLNGTNAGGYISYATGTNTGFTIAHRVKIENAQGSIYDDRLTGNKAGNVLQGEKGQDRIVGLEGNDDLYGGYGDDTLVGSNPSSTSSGIQEYDELTGGGGQDFFILGDRSRAYYQGSGYATIADFDRLAKDRIVVFGSSPDYTLEIYRDGTDIFYKEDRIGYVSDVTDLNFSDFDFI